MENSRIFGIFILLAIALAMTIGVFARRRPGAERNLSQQVAGDIPLSPPVRADYTLMPPFSSPNNDIGLPPPPPPKPCGCGKK